MSMKNLDGSARALVKTDLSISVNQRRDNLSEDRRNSALAKAISFAKVPLLINILYFGWRWLDVFSSLRSSSTVEGIAWIAFLLVEGTFAVSALLNALLISGLGKKWTPQQHLRASGDDVPCVDVFLPCYGESLQIIADTINSAVRQDYPADRYRIVVLDDGGSPAVHELIASMQQEHPSIQLYYTARGAQVKIHSKAANICYGLEWVKSLPGGPAPYFGVLDIDMILGPEWLRATVPYLEEDYEVALAGTPQKFYNLPQGLCLAPRFHLETDVVQRVFDSAGKAVCQGTGYIGRVAAFDAIGGFPTMVKQEDSFIVSIILGAHGWKSRLLEEEHQHGLHAPAYSDIAKLQAKWMTGIMHAYSLFFHPVLSDKPIGKRIAGLIPVLHLTLFRLFLLIALPCVLLLIQTPVIPHTSSLSLLITTTLAFIAYTAVYIQSWFLSLAAEGTISLDDGTRLWNLPYQLKGVLWLAQHAIFGETRMTAFLTTGADCDLSRPHTPQSFRARLSRALFADGGWIHIAYGITLTYLLTCASAPAVTAYPLIAGIAFPPFTKILYDCWWNSLMPLLYCLSPDPNDTPRESLLKRDPKTGAVAPSLEAVTPPTPPFWGAAGTTALMWGFFAAVPVWVVWGW